MGCVFVGRARSDSGECVLGWGAGWVGGSGGKKKLITLWLHRIPRIIGGGDESSESE